MPLSRLSFAPLLIASLWGCSDPPTEGTDASTQTGGSGGTGTGGTVPTGGTGTGGSSTGGQVTGGSGGTTNPTGGAVSSGGETSGGASAGGGTAGAGGIDSSGGASGASGGTAGSGGNSSGGSSGDGGGGSGGAPTLESYAEGLHELFIHDACTGVEPNQPDTCIHDQLHEETVTFGGDPNETYAVTLRVRGLFEPTNVSGGTAPLSEHPYFVVGGTVQAADYSQWHIEVSEPAQTYWLNHYPQTSHTIYQEDFEANLLITGGAEVVVRVVDGNNRQIDNGAMGLSDRQQTIEGVTEGVLDGQLIRLDVVSVTLAD